MLTPRPDAYSFRGAFSLGLPLPLLASIDAALDVIFAFVLAAGVFVAVCLLWRKKSPRHQFVLDLMTAESATEQNVEALPEKKDHVESLKRSA